MPSRIRTKSNVYGSLPKQPKADNKSPEERRFYGSGAWKKLRALHLMREPVCAECTREDRLVPATVVDHHVRIRDGANPYDETNLVSMCVHHHQQKRQRERGIIASH
jgi:5-methylcytosine-specific restriction endonuclease McrA